MAVGVPMFAAEQLAAPAPESSQTDLSLATGAPIHLPLGPHRLRPISHGSPIGLRRIGGPHRRPRGGRSGGGGIFLRSHDAGNGGGGGGGGGVEALLAHHVGGGVAGEAAVVDAEG
ncbi:hypothetical protein HYC85_010533 [Camellia sinensis]|uniref:Uncharacterized protein n=1 Tax=Camellia sinensis TaxID=4442 RepID=A0A7J7HIP3_CAMSI|nr:hypothetical protein HYC85_010533 [Camellia sinensis]